MKEICMCFGFNSEKALKYAKAASDHHKMWDILEAKYIALTDELLTPYIRLSLESGQNPSVRGYWKFAQKVKNNNYIFMQHLTFTILHSMMLLRTGTRNGDAESIHAARSKLLLLFFGRNHPKYQQILSHEIKTEVLMPADVRSLKFKSLSTSRTSRAGHYQSGDALVEEVNKEGKRWIMSLPTMKQWTRSFRNLDRVNHIRKTTLSDMGLADPRNSEYKRQYENSKEVLRIRSVLREHSYLTSPMSEAVHTNLQGKELSSKLVQFLDIAERNFHTALPLILKDESYTIKTVHVTKEEEEESQKVENQTLKEIKQKIQDLISTFDQRDIWDDTYNKDIKNKSKAKHIEFYYQLVDHDISVDDHKKTV